MDELIVISCIFGNKFKKVFPSPDKKNSFFFTNNAEIKEEIVNKGWNYIYVNKPLSDNYIVSSLQSKYIKFLIFLKDYPEFQNSNKSLIIRQTPINKSTIKQEIDQAMGQPRYVKNMNKTNNFVKQMISSRIIKENVRICNTGLLIYINRDKIEELLNNVYNKCMEHEQPECQIYWSIFSQKYKNEIKEIKWTDIKNIKRLVPT